MIYIYTKPGCSGCEELKAQLKAEGTEFIERSPDRWNTPEEVDDIDIEARTQLAMQDGVFPVAVDWGPGVQ